MALPQLRSVDLSDTGVRSWVAGGRLFAQYRGVYAFGRPDLTPEGHWLAAVLACGEGAALSFVAAAANFGVRPSASAWVDVTVPPPSLPRHKGIRAHRAALTAADVTEVDGIPTTSLPRTLLDLATVIGDDALVRACNQAVILKLFDLRAIEELLRRSKGHRGIRRLRRVLEKGDLSGENVPKSGLEIRFGGLCARAGLPKPEVNRYLLLGDEYHQVDFLWRAQRVVVETDGGPYHQTGWQRARDAHRDELLDRHGYLHARIPDEVVDHHPAEAIAVARDLLARSRPRPRPRPHHRPHPRPNPRRESKSDA